MANVESAKKRNRQRLKRRERTLSHLVPMRTRVKRAHAALAKPGDHADAVAPTVDAAIREIAHAAQKGVIHKRTASRRISRLALAMNKAKPIIAAAKAKPATPAAKKESGKKTAGKKAPAAAAPKAEKPKTEKPAAKK